MAGVVIVEQFSYLDTFTCQYIQFALVQDFSPVSGV